jgi:hypothetical protein
MQKFDKEKAFVMFRSKAIEYLYDWRSNPLESNVGIIKYWHEPWKTLEGFEDHRMAEMKGY